MGDSLHCDICGKPATVHLTQIVKNQIQKVDLCEACAQTKGATDAEVFSLAELLTKSFGAKGESGSAVEEEETEGNDLVCEQCGCGTRNFKKSGRLGCAACYDALRAVLLPLLGGLHKGKLHRGKVPARQQAGKALQKELAGVEQRLLEAIKDEDFEEAARCRDRLAELKNRLEMPMARSGAEGAPSRESKTP